MFLTQDVCVSVDCKGRRKKNWHSWFGWNGTLIYLQGSKWWVLILEYHAERRRSDVGTQLMINKLTGIDDEGGMDSYKQTVYWGFAKSSWWLRCLPTEHGHAANSSSYRQLASWSIEIDVYLPSVGGFWTWYVLNRLIVFAASACHWFRAVRGQSLVGSTPTTVAILFSFLVKGFLSVHFSVYWVKTL